MSFSIPLHRDCKIVSTRPRKPIRLLGDLDAIPQPVKVKGRGPAGKARRAARIAARALHDAWKGIVF